MEIFPHLLPVSNPDPGTVENYFWQFNRIFRETNSRPKVGEFDEKAIECLFVCVYVCVCVCVCV